MCLNKYYIVIVVCGFILLCLNLLVCFILDIRYDELGYFEINIICYSFFFCLSSELNDDFDLCMYDYKLLLDLI